MKNIYSVLLASLIATAPVFAGTLPDDDPNTHRFVNINKGLSSLGDGNTNFNVQVDGNKTDFSLGIYDGAHSPSTATWDAGSDTASNLFTLYADPNATGNTNPGDQVAQWTSTTLPAEDWFDVVLPNAPAALGSNGNYTYNLQVTWVNSSSDELNSFKIRSDSDVFVKGGSTLGFQAAPSIVSFSPVIVDYGSYDGSWRFSLLLPNPLPELDLWNGDFDVANDTDDPNTTTLPPFFTPANTLAEGVNPGDPQDDSASDFFRFEPAPRITITSPDGTWSITDFNPSGDEEWELLRLRTSSNGTEDFVVPSLPAGLYDILVEGIDGQNTFFLHSDFTLNTIPEPLSAILIGISLLGMGWFKRKK